MITMMRATGGFVCVLMSVGWDGGSQEKARSFEGGGFRDERKRERGGTERGRNFKEWAKLKFKFGQPWCVYCLVSL